ncbi:MAG: protein-glutamate O-methyltransferase CheR [Desulfovibrionales bacterium]|nr:protein-glutamate O-methyltransferase CheR [Desulfovibrionales bacterium]
MQPLKDGRDLSEENDAGHATGIFARPGVSSTEANFKPLQKLIEEKTGIFLPEHKKMLFTSRLNSRFKSLGLKSIDAYTQYLRHAPDAENELARAVDCLTTHTTHFYREKHHFEFLNDVVFPHLLQEGEKNGVRRLAVWCAGCSTGEEVYTVAITTNTFWGQYPSWKIKIMATDISREILEVARTGIYPHSIKKNIPTLYLRSFFTEITSDGLRCLQVKPILENIISFEEHNLMDGIPSPFPFDIIFCRNVLIYMGKEAKKNILNTFYRALRDDGFLFLGHSESLIGLNDKFYPMGRTIYQKIPEA